MESNPSSLEKIVNMAQARSEETPSASAAWQRVAAKLRFTHGEATYNSWIKPMRAEGIEGTEVQISVPTRFMRDWVLSHYAADLLRFWHEENSTILSVNVRVKGNVPPHQITEGHEQAITGISNVPATQAEEFPRAGGASLHSLSARLDPRFTFESFVVGPTNQLAFEAARSIAEARSIIPGSNPLFLYGGVGLGKTHLMQAIAQHIKQHNPSRKVIYLSAEEFMYQFIQAIQRKDVVSFKEFFRSVDVLMVDDIQFICGKNSTQEEFFHTFNELVDSKKQLILSGDRSPSDLDGMEDRIKSRLGWGLVADINSTTYELRLGILQSKVERMAAPVPQDVLEFLAGKITSNVRELEGALNKVVAHASLMKQDITLDTTRAILRDLLRCNEKSITIEDIKQTVADHHAIRLSDMHSARRARNIARPRQIAMYLSKKLTSCSLPEIGRKFGGKDHTTVIHAVRKVEELCGQDKDFRENVELLLRSLQG